MFPRFIIGVDPGIVHIGVAVFDVGRNDFVYTAYDRDIVTVEYEENGNKRRKLNTYNSDYYTAIRDWLVDIERIIFERIGEDCTLHDGVLLVEHQAFHYNQGLLPSSRMEETLVAQWIALRGPLAKRDDAYVRVVDCGRVRKYYKLGTGKLARDGKKKAVTSFVKRKAEDEGWIVLVETLNARSKRDDIADAALLVVYYLDKLRELGHVVDDVVHVQRSPNNDEVPKQVERVVLEPLPAVEGTISSDETSGSDGGDTIAETESDLAKYCVRAHTMGKNYGLHQDDPRYMKVRAMLKAIGASMPYYAMHRYKNHPNLARVLAWRLYFPGYAFKRDIAARERRAGRKLPDYCAIGHEWEPRVAELFRAQYLTNPKLWALFHEAYPNYAATRPGAPFPSLRMREAKGPQEHWMHPKITASPDRALECRKVGHILCLLEIKFRASGAAIPRKCPDYYVDQVQHQLEVWDVEMGFLIMAREKDGEIQHRIWPILRDRKRWAQVLLPLLLRILVEYKAIVQRQKSLPDIVGR